MYQVQSRIIELYGVPDGDMNWFLHISDVHEDDVIFLVGGGL
jgi:hypothetical protein